VLKDDWILALLSWLNNKVPETKDNFLVNNEELFLSNSLFFKLALKLEVLL
jgi:hypothetical protein